MPASIPPEFKTHAARRARAEAKRLALLRWLASGETYTTPVLAARVMACSRRAADDTIKACERDGLLVREVTKDSFHHATIIGLTPRGAALAGDPGGRYHQAGRVSLGYLSHHLDTQAARLAAEEAGWAGWEPGRVLTGAAFQKNSAFKKVPDALVIRPDGRRVAIEIERHVKTSKRYADIIAAHLLEMKKGSWDLAIYLCPHVPPAAVEAAMRSVKAISIAGDRVPLEDKHWRRFQFYSLADWPQPTPAAAGGAEISPPQTK